jgi:NNP family nitrate/nitrite transporter-like MFS transporter
MRSFHFSWMLFFLAFLSWFSFSSLSSAIRKDLDLTKQEEWLTRILGLSSTIFFRFLMGPLCDKFGAKINYLIIMLVGAIATFSMVFVDSAISLMVV